jgi:hypothetical protein
MAESLKRISGVEGDAYMKDTDHPIRHLCAHFGDRASARWRGSYARQNAQDGCGMAPCWAGATPLCRLSAAQKVRGVAAARSAGSVTAFCPRAHREVLRKASGTIFPLATHGSRLELNRRVVGECLFSRRHKWRIAHIAS